MINIQSLKILKPVPIFENGEIVSKVGHKTLTPYFYKVVVNKNIRFSDNISPFERLNLFAILWFTSNIILSIDTAKKHTKFCTCREIAGK